MGEGIDLAIRYGQLKDSSLIAKKITDVIFDLWASPCYVKKHGLPKTGKDLKKHSIIRFTAWSPTLKFSQNKEIIEISTSSRFVVDDLSSVKEFAIAGQGIGILPHFMGAMEAERKRLVRVSSTISWATIPLSFVYPPQRFVSLKVQSFIQWVMENRKVFSE